MKRYIYFVLIVFSVIHFSCSRRESGTLTLSVGGAPSEIAFWEEIIREFEDRTGTVVQILRQPTDTEQRRQGLVIPLKARKQDPDVFLMDVAWIGQFAASGWLEPLQGFMKKKGLSADVFFQNVLRTADMSGENLIALPVYIDGGILYYRKDLLKQFGYSRPPETWDELVSYSLKIQEKMRAQKKDFYGYVWQGAQYEGLICHFLEVAASNNGGIILEDNAMSLNTPENIKAVLLMYDFIHTHKISPPHTYTAMKEEEVRLFFQSGQALFERNWPYAWALHQEQGSFVRNKVAIAPLPHFPGGKSVSTLGGWHIGISRFSDQKKKSYELVKYITSYDIQKRFALEMGWNPGRQDVYNDEEVQNSRPYFSDLKEVFEGAISRPNVPYYTLLSEVIQRHLNSALSGKISPEQALIQAEKEALTIIERYEIW